VNCNIAAIRQQVLDLLICILVPQMAGTADRMPQVHGTCPKYNGNGTTSPGPARNHPGRGALGAVRPSQPRTDADRIGKAIRIGLPSIMFHYRDQPPLACNWLGAPALSSLKIF